MALCTGNTPTTSAITLKRLTSGDRGGIPPTNDPSMEWNCSPNWFVPVKKGGRKGYELSLDSLGQITLRFNQKNFSCVNIFAHRPLGISSVAVGFDPIIEISLVFLNTENGAKQFVHWIFPVVQLWGGSHNDLLFAWLSNNSKSQSFSTFADFLPDTFRYTQWVQCYLDSTGAQSRAVPVTFCYSEEPLRVDFRPIDLSGKVYTFFPASTDLDAPSGIPYSFTNETDRTWDAAFAATFASYSIRNTQTSRYRERQKQKKLAKCFSVSLERDIDAQGMISVDPTTQQPLDPMEMRGLQGSVNPQGELSNGINQDDIDAAQKQKDSVNTVILWVLVGILCFIMICIALYVILAILSGKPLFTVKTAVAAATGTGGPGVITVTNPLYPGAPGMPPLEQAAVAAAVAGAAGQ